MVLRRSDVPSKPRKPKLPTKLTIAIDGEGVTLKDIGLRQLAQLLEATASAFEAVAQEKHLEAPKLSLAKAKQGSAAYELVSDDPQADRVVKSFVTTVRKRGKGSSPRTRTSLLRLHSTATKTGAGLRIDSGEPGDKKQKPLYLAIPIEEDTSHVEEGTVVYARVVGLKLDAHDRGTVMLRYDDGGSGDFESSPDLLTEAARLIGKHVAARVTFQRGEVDFEGEIERLEERAAPSQFLEAVSAARKTLEEQGIVFDATAWLAEEAGERDE